jgi:hypothetical protein
LAVLTQAEFQGRDALMAQVGGARATSGCDCGCATIDLSVDNSLPASVGDDGKPRHGVLPNEATVVDGTGDVLGGLIIFVDAGYLSSAEIYSVSDEPIADFPTIECIRPAWT